MGVGVVKPEELDLAKPYAREGRKKEPVKRVCVRAAGQPKKRSGLKGRWTFQTFKVVSPCEKKRFHLNGRKRRKVPAPWDR